MIDQTPSDKRRGTNLAIFESHTTLQNGKWVEMHLVSGKDRGDVFKNVTDPDWDELCTIPAGESPVVEGVVVSRNEFVTPGTKRRRQSSTATPAAKKAAKKANNAAPAMTLETTERPQEDDDFIADEDDEMKDDDDLGSQTETPRAMTALTCQSPQAANKMIQPGSESDDYSRLVAKLRHPLHRALHD